jgi:hypothetical protein
MRSDSADLSRRERLLSHRNIHQTLGLRAEWRNPLEKRTK